MEKIEHNSNLYIYNSIVLEYILYNKLKTVNHLINKTNNNKRGPIFVKQLTIGVDNFFSKGA